MGCGLWQFPRNNATTHMRLAQRMRTTDHDSGRFSPCASPLPSKAGAWRVVH